jgi:hypothetical protein
MSVQFHAQYTLDSWLREPRGWPERSGEGKTAWPCRELYPIVQPTASYFTDLAIPDHTR